MTANMRICNGIWQRNPTAGDLIPRSGGVRKLRWKRRGTGKRGGLRVIYYIPRTDLIWLLTVHAKSATENIPAKILKQIKEELDND